MGGGESDARYWQMATTELEGFSKCEVPHCDWQVRLPARRCYTHDGPQNAAQYRSSTDGARFDVKIGKEGMHA